MSLDLALLACVCCFVAGMLLAAWRARDAVRVARVRLELALKDLAGTEQRADALEVSLRVHQGWLSNSDRLLGEAQLEIDRLKRGDGPNEAA